MATLDRTQDPRFNYPNNYFSRVVRYFRTIRGDKFFLFRDIQQEVVKLDLVFFRWQMVLNPNLAPAILPLNASKKAL